MTGETLRSREPAGRGSFIGNLLAFFNALAAFIESRLSLVAKESRAALGQILGALACIAGALLFFSLGYVFLVVSLIVGIAHLIQVGWPWVALAAAILHFALVLILLLGARGIMSKPLFQELLAELKKDREWLKNLQETSRPGS